MYNSTRIIATYVYYLHIVSSGTDCIIINNIKFQVNNHLYSIEDYMYAHAQWDFTYTANLVQVYSSNLSSDSGESAAIRVLRVYFL